MPTMPSSRTLLAFVAIAISGFGQASSNIGASEAPPIVVDRAGSEIFPASWLTKKIDAKAEVLRDADRERARRIIVAALEKYPPAVLAANLQSVYLVGRLEYSGVVTGGTNSRDVVYVVAPGDYSSAKIERIFHAEFSSILLRNHRRSFAEEAWLKINPPDFRYLGSGVQAVREKQASTALQPALHEQGFLNKYGQASIEEDFNSFAGRLLLGDAQLWAAVERYPAVKAKADHVIEFYGRLDPGFTPEFFQSLQAPAGR